MRIVFKLALLGVWFSCAAAVEDLDSRSERSGVADRRCVVMDARGRLAVGVQVYLVQESPQFRILEQQSTNREGEAVFESQEQGVVVAVDGERLGVFCNDHSDPAPTWLASKGTTDIKLRPIYFAKLKNPRNTPWYAVIESPPTHYCLHEIRDKLVDKYGDGLWVVQTEASTRIAVHEYGFAPRQVDIQLRSQKWKDDPDLAVPPSDTKQQWATVQVNAGNSQGKFGGGVKAAILRELYMKPLLASSDVWPAYRVESLYGADRESSVRSLPAHAMSLRIGSQEVAKIEEGELIEGKVISKTFSIPWQPVIVVGMLTPGEAVFVVVEERSGVQGAVRRHERTLLRSINMSQLNTLGRVEATVFVHPGVVEVKSRHPGSTEFRDAVVARIIDDLAELQQLEVASQEPK